MKLNASPVRRKQKAVPFKKEKGRWGKHCKTEDYRDMVHFSNSRSRSVAYPNKIRDEVCTGTVSASS